MELDEVRAYASGWRVAWATRTGRWVATRIGGLSLGEKDPRRYALFANDLDDLVAQIDRQRTIDIERGNGTPMTNQISSWSSSYVPSGTPVRYLLDDTGSTDETIRLVLGDADQLELTVTRQTALAITASLDQAVHALAAPKDPA